MIRTIAALILLISTLTSAQIPFGEYRAEISPRYHYIAVPGVGNFTCLISSQDYINFIKPHADSSHFYPLKLVWIRDHGFYHIINQPIPELTDSLHRKMLYEMQILKNQIMTIMDDWQTYGVYPPPATIPMNSVVHTLGDSMRVDFTYENNGEQVNCEALFSKAGRLLRLVVKSPERRILTTPQFKEVRGRWVCTGWDRQESEQDSVVGGVAVRMELIPWKSYIVPGRIDVAYQKSGDKGRRRLPQIFLKSYEFNQNIQIVPADADSTSAGQ